MTDGGRGHRRRAAVALAAVVAVGVAVLIATALEHTMLYYRTPSEVASAPPAAGERIRLGGRVLPGSLRETGGQTRFRLTDGRDQIPVVGYGTPPGSFREGRDAVVEGILGGDGVFRSDTVMVKHSNEYRPREGAP
jgi:cytochrome c-type biogenesis protein CcmE